jgi:hypothetical protein
MLATKLAKLGHFQFLLHLFLVPLGVMRDATAFGAFHLHQGIFDLSHSLRLLFQKECPHTTGKIPFRQLSKNFSPSLSR